MSPLEYPPTPTLDRMVELGKTGDLPVIQHFIDWLTDQGIGYWKGRDQYQRPIEYHPDPEQLMRDFFGIDSRKVDQERRALLDYVRARDD